MSENAFDYPRAKNLVERVNTLRVNGCELQSYFSYKGYNFWQVYQTDLFIEAKRFTKEGDAVCAALEKNSRFALLFAFLSAIFYSFALLIGLVRGAPVLVYTVDKKPQGPNRCDFRLEELYDALRETHTRYMECIHTPSSGVLLQHFMKRKRIGFYTNCGDAFAWVASWWRKPSKGLLAISFEGIDFTPEEQQFIRAFFKKARHDFFCVPYRVMCMRIFMRLARVKRVYVIDDVWHYFECMCAALLEKREVVSIQHGHFTKYHLGVLPHVPAPLGKLIMPDRYLLWSAYWREELIRLGTYIPHERLFVGGSKGFLESAEKEKTRRGYIGVLIPYETDVPKGRMSPYIHALHTRPDIRLFFKPRPDLEVDQQLEQYGLTTNDVTICVSARECGEMADVVIGTYTTFLYDMVLLGMRVVLLREVLDYGEGMIENGLADGARSPEALYEVVVEAYRKTDTIQKERREKLIREGEGRLADFLSRDLQTIN